MITSQRVLEQLTAYLNHDINLSDLVYWAENAVIEAEIPETEDADLLMDVLTYVAAADTRGFPLTWDILSDFLSRLGGNVRVVVERA